MSNDADDAILRWQSRLNTVLIEYFIFKTLSKESSYGAAILEHSQKYLQNVKIPTVYAIIKRSIELGLIKKLPAQQKAEKTRGTARQYYTLTRDGHYFHKSVQSYFHKVFTENKMLNLEDKQ